MCGTDARRSRRGVWRVRLCATDIDWQWGDGPEIRGPGEAIFFAMLKKRMLLDKLDGDGVTVLTARF